MLNGGIAMWREGGSGPGEVVVQGHIRREDGGDQKSTAYGQEDDKATKDVGRTTIDGQRWGKNSHILPGCRA